MKYILLGFLIAVSYMCGRYRLAWKGCSEEWYYWVLCFVGIGGVLSFEVITLLWGRS